MKSENDSSFPIFKINANAARRKTADNSESYKSHSSLQSSRKAVAQKKSLKRKLRRTTKRRSSIRSRGRRS